MINYNYEDDLLADGAVKQFLLTDGTVTVSGTSCTVTGQTVTITNAELDAEQFELGQSLCSSDQLRFGSCESGYIKFTMHENIATLKGKALKLYIMPNGDASKMVQIGVFKVDEDELASDRTKRTITAYDAMYDIINADVAAWYNAELPTSSSSKTLAQFRADFLSHFNITAETITLPNDSFTVKRTIDPESLSGSDMARWICELNGCFGMITNEGKFRYVVLSSGIDDGLFPSDTLYPADDLYPQDVNHDVTVLNKGRYKTVDFEDWNAESITQLTIRTDDSDVGTTVGTAGNGYVITGNILTYGCNTATLTTVATNALANMTNRYYRPCTVNAVGNPLHEVGDPIRIATQYRGIVTYILERTLKGIQALTDTYAAKGKKKCDKELNSMTAQFKQLSGKVTKIKVDTDGIESRVEDIEDGTASVIQQLDNEISLKVSKSNIVSDLNDKMSGITIQSDKILVSSSGTFTVDATNFKLNAQGQCTLGSVSFTGGEITMTNGSGLELYHGGISVDNNGYLDINGRNSGAGSSSFYSVAINGDNVHINYQGTDTRIYNCSYIYNGTGTSLYSYIRLDEDTWGMSLVGGNGTKIKIDTSSSAYGIVLDGSVNIGNGSSNTIRIKGKDVKWVTETINGTSYKILVED